MQIVMDDGSGASHVLSSTPGGPTCAIARNQLNDSEFGGPTFTADGHTVFVTMHDPGLTLAITGPWEKHLTMSPPSTDSAGRGSLRRSAAVHVPVILEP